MGEGVCSPLSLSGTQVIGQIKGTLVSLNFHAGDTNEIQTPIQASR